MNTERRTITVTLSVDRSLWLLVQARCEYLGLNQSTYASQLFREDVGLGSLRTKRKLPDPPPGDNPKLPGM